jgi:hypothetical protein
MESRGRTFLQEIRDAIESSERVIVVIGPEAVNSDYCRSEWEHALLFGKGVLPILRLGSYDIVPTELAKFYCPDFREEQDFEQAIEELVRLLSEPVPPLGKFLCPLPQLPPHFHPRHEQLANLALDVMDDTRRPVVITSAKQTIAIQGMGGVGKSVLATSFARMAETRRAFQTESRGLSRAVNRKC